ncbi:hypothetical protein RSSM_06196 [Rhodopirellula sallentina SM41]|uniref:Uncharacterized protein n=1 Tax=Rhodopirellula sallentina SM41 TaxID=1263870 RepID=M5U8T7_9BACT|nr:hypothetical protein RSSM_06196 [Rhodopirellula sallentina SM41]
MKSIHCCRNRGEMVVSLPSLVTRNIQLQALMRQSIQNNFD